MGQITVDRGEYLEQLKTLVNIESGSYDPEGINRVADQLETWYRDLGWHIQRHHLDDRTGDLLEISIRLGATFHITVDDETAFLRSLRLLADGEALARAYPHLSEQRREELRQWREAGDSTPPLTLGDLADYAVWMSRS